MARLLTRRREAGSPIDPEVAWAWDRIVVGRGPVRVERLAAEGGYADQSHLHRDVVAFTGVTPTTVAGEPWLAVDDVTWAGHAAPAQDRERGKSSEQAS